MAPSKTTFPITPRLRLPDGSLDWPAIALRNTASAASVTDVHSQKIYGAAYQAQLQEHADTLWAHAEGAWDRFFQDLPAAPRSCPEGALMCEHYVTHLARANTLCTSGALTAPAAQRLRDHMQRWRQQVGADIERPTLDSQTESSAGRGTGAGPRPKGRDTITINCPTPTNTAAAGKL